MIIDGHAHISDSEYGNIELYIRALDEAGIDKGIIVPGGTVDVRELSRYVTGKKVSNKNFPNDVVFKAVRDYPDRLHFLVGIDPYKEDESMEIFEKAVEMNCIGIKLSPMTHNFPFDLEFIDKISEECGKRGMVVYSHSRFNPLSGTYAYGELAKRHPETNFILGHLGCGDCDADAFELARDIPNLYLEASIGTYLALNSAVKISGTAKILFGSEFPLSNPKIQKYQIEQLKIKNIEKKGILGLNIIEICPALKKELLVNV